MTGALFWINVPLTEKRQNKKQNKNLRTLSYSTCLLVFWYLVSTMSFGIFENITDIKKI